MVNWTQIRDTVLFVTGLGGVVYETLSGKPVDPSLLLMFGAMMGLPAFLRKDDR